MGLCRKFKSYIELASVLYLSVPLILFFYGWLKPIIAIPLLLILGVLIILYLRDAYLYSSGSKVHISKSFWGISVVVIFIWVLLSGVGIGNQQGDFDKHNAVLRDLIHYHWPVVYSIDNQVNSLIYYIAFYLPSALIGKVFGWEAAIIGQFMWTLIGVLISFYWIVAICKKSTLYVPIVFIFFSGADSIAYILSNGHMFHGTQSIEWHTPPWQYSSITTLLYWVPQHFLPGILITTLMIQQVLEQKNKKNIGFLFALSALWSPFVTIGLLPFLILVYIRPFEVKSIVTLRNALSAIILLVIILYVLSGSGAGISGWIWEGANLYDMWPNLLLFYFVEFGLYFIVIRKSIVLDSKDFQLWFYSAIIMLLLIPFYFVGLNNDFTMRASIPAIIVLLISVIKTIDYEKMTPKILGIVILLGAFTGGIEISNSLSRLNHKTDGWYSLLVAPVEVRDQYLGSVNNLFFLHLAKDNENLEVNPVVYSLNDFTWDIWDNEDTYKATLDTNKRIVTSKLLVDAGITANINLTPGNYIVKVRVSGVIYSESPAQNAAHLSIHGIKPIIRIPPGDYHKGKDFYARLYVDKQYNKISFGLGGWSKGRGKIELDDLKIIKWTENK